MPGTERHDAREDQPEAHCEACGWSTRGDGASALAAEHSRQTGHAVTVAFPGQPPQRFALQRAEATPQPSPFFPGPRRGQRR